jgi:hypothetical protein
MGAFLLPKAIAEWIEDRLASLDKPYHPEDFKNLITTTGFVLELA